METVRCAVVCGSANNQLADDRLAERLAARSVLYAPDFIVNAGGLISVSLELGPTGYDEAYARERVAGIEVVLATSCTPPPPAAPHRSPPPRSWPARASTRPSAPRFPPTTPRAETPAPAGLGPDGDHAAGRRGGTHGDPAGPPRITARGTFEGAPERLTRDDRVALLRYMLLMRGLEERAMNLYRQGKVPGSFYDGFGQEAVSAGPAFAMAAEDRLCVLHRDLAAHLVRGVEPARVLGQYMGRAGGITAGRDGNVHFGDHTRGCVGMVSMLRHDARGHGHGDGVQAAGRAPGRAHLVRRRLDVAGRLARGHELGGRPAAAGRVRAREQPVRLLDAARPAVRGRSGGARRRPQGSPASPSTGTTSRRCSRPPAWRASAPWPARARR